jgi:hypothetical protein
MICVWNSIIIGKHWWDQESVSVFLLYSGVSARAEGKCGGRKCWGRTGGTRTRRRLTGTRVQKDFLASSNRQCKAWGKRIRDPAVIKFGETRSWPRTI